MVPHPALRVERCYLKNLPVKKLTAPLRRDHVNQVGEKGVVIAKPLLVARVNRFMEVSSRHGVFRAQLPTLLYGRRNKRVADG